MNPDQYAEFTRMPQIGPRRFEGGDMTSLREMLLENPGQDPQCSICYDSKDGYYSDHLRPGFRKECPNCREKHAWARFEKYAQRRKGAIVDFNLMANLQASNKITHEILLMAAPSRKPESCILVGETRIGKSLLAQKWYNDLLLNEYGGNPGKLMMIRERELVEIFGDDERTEELFAMMRRRQIDWFFGQEFFHEDTYIDANTNRDGSMNVHRRMKQFVDDYLIETTYAMKGIVLTSNNMPNDVIKAQTGNQKAWAMRFHEIGRIIKLNPKNRGAR